MLSSIAAVLGKVPAWVWVVVIVAAAIGVKEYRDQKKIAALQKQVDTAQTQAIEQARAAVQKDLGALTSKQSTVEQAVKAQERRVAESEARVAQINSTLAGQEKEHKRLVESGTVDEVVAKGRSLGYKAEPARKGTR